MMRNNFYLIKPLRSNGLYRLFSSISQAESAFTESPQYPEWAEVSYEEKWRRKKVDWHKAIERLPTVEQKFVELNMPRYYGHYSVILKDETLRPYGSNFIKFITRTEMNDNYPSSYYKDEEESVDKLVDSIKPFVEELILLHNSRIINSVSNEVNNQSVKKKEKNITENFLIGLNQIMMKFINNPEFDATSVDIRPRIEGFWWVGGFEAPSVLRNGRRKNPVARVIADEPIDRAMRSSVRPVISVRTLHGLPEMVALDFQGVPEASSAIAESSEPVEETSQLDQQNERAELPSESPLDHFDPYTTDPKAWGALCRRKRAVIIPGFWPGEKCEYGQLCLYSRPRSSEFREKYGEFASDVEQSILTQRASLYGFTQALSFAFYQGFTPVNELTYPVVQQFLMSDGQRFRFGLYQLNTCCLHTRLSVDNPRRNFLWLSEDQKLYESVEGDSVKGLNEVVLRRICAAYVKKSKQIANPHPYLADHKYLMNHAAPDEYKEEFLNFARTVSRDRRTSSRVIPEITPWERIYKIYFKTRHFDHKAKFFENRWAENPYTRRLDDYKLPYIPKVRRMNFKIRYQPRINSKHLFKHDWQTIKKDHKLFETDEIAFETMNIRKDTPPYYNGLKWSRGMTSLKPKL